MKAIKARRLACGMRQVELAELVGVTQSVVSYWETDRSDPPCSILPKLAEIFNCTIDELFATERKEEDTVKKNQWR